MYRQKYSEPTPSSAAAPDCKPRRRHPSPQDRRDGSREGRSRSVQGERQGQGRRFRSSDPGGTELHMSKAPYASNKDGLSQVTGRSRTPGRRVEEENLLMREVEQLRGRTQQMERHMRLNVC